MGSIFGRFSAHIGPLEVAKKFHMGGVRRKIRAFALVLGSSTLSFWEIQTAVR